MLVALVAAAAIVLSIPTLALAAPAASVTGGPFQTRGTGLTSVPIHIDGGAPGLMYEIETPATAGTASPPIADPDNGADLSYTAAPAVADTTDSFVVRVTDPGDSSFTDVPVSVEVRADAAPTATAPASPYYVRGHAPVTVHIAANSSVFTYAVEGDPTGGTVDDITKVSGGADATFTPTADGTATFTVRVTDPDAADYTDVPVTLHVRADGPPAATVDGGPFFTRGTTPVPIHIDGGAPGFTYDIQTAASAGTASTPVTGGNGADLTYTADAPVGDTTDTFVVRVTDPSDSSFTDVPVSVELRADAAPAASAPDSPYYVRGHAPVSVHIAANSSVFSYEVRDVVGGTADEPVKSGNGADVSFTPTADGTATFTVRVTDPDANDFTDVPVTLHVRPDAAPAATLTNGPFYVRAGQVATAHIDGGAPGFSYTTSDETDGTAAAAVTSGTGADIDFTTDSGFTGDASFVVHVTDPAGPGGGDTTDVPVTVHVRPAAVPSVDAPDSPYETRGADPVTVSIVAEFPGSYDYNVLGPVTGGSVGSFTPAGDKSGATATFTAEDGFAGAASFTVRVTDPDGGPSDYTDVPVTVVVHPASEILTGPGSEGDTNNGLSTTAHPTFTYRASTGTGAGAGIAGATFRCKVDGGSFVTCNSGTYTVPATLSEGAHTFTVRAATNSSTNVDPSPTTVNFVVDTVFPTLSIDSGPASGDTPYSATFAFTHGTDPNGSVITECRLITPSDADPSWTTCTTPADYSGLDAAGGDYRFEVRAIDPAGNTTTQGRDFTTQATPQFDTEGVAPVLGSFGATSGTGGALTYAVVSGPDHGTLDNGVTLPDFSYTADAGFSGRDIVRVRTTDENGGDQVRDVPIDVHPTSSFSAVPDDPNPSVRPTWTFTSPVDGVTYECNLDNGGWADCGGDSFTPSSDLSEGSHTLEVRATSHPLTGDLVQITPISSSVVVDTTHPDVSIDSQPASLSADTAPAFTFSTTDNTATFQCKVDDGDWATCDSGDHIATQADGDHTFSVRAKDPATNVTEPPASYTWEIDSHGPVIALGGAPVGITNGPGEGGVTNARKPTWYYSVADNGAGATQDDHLDVGSITCTVDARPVATCPVSPWAPAANLSDGSHTLHIVAQDTLGNTTDHTETFTVDTVPPPVVITDTPNGKSGASATFAFQSDEDNTDATFECSTTGVSPTPWAACTSPTTLTGLTSGQRTFKVRAIDPAGNQSTTPATYTWLAKSEIPATSLDRKPAVQTTGNDNVFTWHSDQDPLVTFECKLDSGAFAACQSGYAPATAVGVHTLTIQGTNDVGAREATGATYTWTVTTPATTTQSTVTQTTTVDHTVSTTVTGPTTTVDHTTTGPSIHVCDVIPASPGSSKSVAVAKGLKAAVSVSRTLGRMGVDTYKFGVSTSGKGSKSARTKALAKNVKSIQLLQGSTVVATLKGSSWKSTLSPTAAGKVKLTVKVNRKKGKALKSAVTLTVLPTCPTR